MIRSRMAEYMEPAEAAEKPQPLFIPPPLYLLAAAGAMVLLDRLAPRPHIVPKPLRGLGLLGILGGLGLGAWSAMQFRQAGTPIIPTREPKALVTEGPFRFSRNPIYLGMALVLGGVGVLLTSLLPLVVVPVFLGLLTSRVIRREEQAMEQAFGEVYRQYKGKVPRWLRLR